MERGFKKISYEQFSKDICSDQELYNSYRLPVRKTKFSAGYDFLALEDFEIMPGEIKKIPTGYKAFFKENEMLLIIVRSSLGFKYNVRLCNQIGLIESDYYNNVGNEGHMWIALKNEGDKVVQIKKGEGFVQGVFTNFLTCGDEPNDVRVGGIGSTNERK